jgi:hypothetical protein
MALITVIVSVMVPYENRKLGSRNRRALNSHYKLNSHINDKNI